MSKESDTFVSNLKASIESWRMPAETESLYKSKLAKFVLTRAQWSSALDEIINQNRDGKLPPLANVCSILEHQKAIASVPVNLGWASFKIKGVSHSIRIRSEGGKWVIHDLVWVDNHGKEHHLQNYVGDSVAQHIPADATDYLLSADNPAKPEPDEMPSPAEIKALVDKTNQALGKATSAKVARFREAANR